jgi:hypothetical protein
VVSAGLRYGPRALIAVKEKRIEKIFLSIEKNKPERA